MSKLLRTGARPRALVVGLLLTGLVAACVPPPADPPAPDPWGLTADLHAGRIEMSWNPTALGEANGYQVQWHTEGGGWTTLPTVAATTLEFTEVEPRVRYRFRVRAVNDPGTPLTPWSKPVLSTYVEPQLPILRIDTDDRIPIVVKETRLPASMQLDPNGTDVEPYEGRLLVNGRGNSTWNQHKKPYRLRLDSASELMGMPSNRHWVLLANALDQSQVRTTAAMAMSEATDLAWTPRFRHVELILNGEYAGIYLLGEHIRIGADRVAINSMSPSHVSGNQLTGGYLLEVDRRRVQNDEPGFLTSRNLDIVINDPEPATPEQFGYIRDYVQGFEDTLFSSGYTHPDTGYRAFLDVDSFIDWYLVHEATRHHDSFFSSTWFYKPRGDKLHFGPVWDFDQSMGSRHGGVDPTPVGWLTRDRGRWVSRLFTDPALRERVAERWDMFKADFSELPDQLDTLGVELTESIANDEFRWRYSRAPEDTVDYVSDWLRTRLDWMDAEFAAGG